LSGTIPPFVCSLDMDITGNNFECPLPSCCSFLCGTCTTAPATPTPSPTQVIVPTPVIIPTPVIAPPFPSPSLPPVAPLPLPSLSEVNALRDLYEALGGPSWRMNDKWMSSSSPCEWFGIHCVGSIGNVRKEKKPKEKVTHVNQILLPNNTLVGTLPSTIGILTFVFFSLLYLFLS
jgi:hypothetical protein